MKPANFLIGRGHLLTRQIPSPGRAGAKKPVYGLDEARGFLTPEIKRAIELFDAVPPEACPKDIAVARLMLNPAFIARSFFPSRLLKEIGLESVGSRTVRVTPRKWTKKETPRECSTTEIFVAGERTHFRNLNAWAGRLTQDMRVSEEFARVEHFSAFTADERLTKTAGKNETYEVGMHLLPGENTDEVKSAFLSYAANVEVETYRDITFTAGNLWFIPVRGERSAIEKLAQFTLVRVVRPMPNMRTLRPPPRAGGVTIACGLPAEQPLSADTKVAILDGGLPERHPIGKWVRSYRKLDLDAVDVPEGVAHGLAVTSAFLFGPITPNTQALRPYSYVDHLRVHDSLTGKEDPLELYRTLGLIEEVLLSKQYQFVNLSLGPNLPIEDEEVHAWTSVIDNLLSDGNTLMTVAVGNNGSLDHASGNDRVQVPSDCVNAISVGAASSVSNDWSRASYSAIGPGRLPGIIKPDLMAFGGSAPNYFHALSADEGEKPTLAPLLGTSFAAPYLLRNAVGIGAIMGTGLSPLTIKALVVHSADAGSHDKLHVGWGKVPEDLMRIITCPDGVARIVYEGELIPGKYLRAPVPLPQGSLDGDVVLKATFCYASPTDPQDAASYTRAGLEITFRPDIDNIKEGQKTAKTRTFFDIKKYSNEGERRSDHGKWETVVHGVDSFRGNTLKKPAFDIHYNAREGGASTSRANMLKYALIISIEAPKHVNLYNDILHAHAEVLLPITPQISLPIRL